MLLMVAFLPETPVTVAAMYIQCDLDKTCIYIIIWKQMPCLLHWETTATLGRWIVCTVLDDDFLLDTVYQTPELILHH